MIWSEFNLESKKLTASTILYKNSQVLNLLESGAFYKHVRILLFPD